MDESVKAIKGPDDEHISRGSFVIYSVWIGEHYG